MPTFFRHHHYIEKLLRFFFFLENVIRWGYFRLLDNIERERPPKLPIRGLLKNRTWGGGCIERKVPAACFAAALPHVTPTVFQNRLISPLLLHIPGTGPSRYLFLHFPPLKSWILFVGLMFFHLLGLYSKSSFSGTSVSVIFNFAQ